MIKDIWAGEIGKLISDEILKQVLPPKLYEAYKSPETNSVEAIVSEVNIETKTITLKSVGKND